MPDLRTRALALSSRLLLALPPGLVRRLLPARVIDGHRLSPEIQLLLLGRRLARLPDFAELPVERGRREIENLTWAMGGRQEIGATVDLDLDGLPGRLYVPTERLGQERVPTLLFLHGGGWIYGGGFGTHDAACRFLAERSGVQLLAVDYRLAPEHPWPAPLEDCKTALRWMVAHTADLHADPDRLGVGGDSAGGNMAAVLASWAAEQGLSLAFQLLIYPGTDFASETRSKDLFRHEDLILSDTFIEKAKASYAAPEEDPEASPLRRPTILGDQAPAHVVTAGFDPLRDEGEDYAARLREAGVSTTVVREPGLIHGFLHILGVGREARAANADLADALRRGLGAERG